jgi:hypothetical protein
VEVIMNALMIRSKVKPESVVEVEVAARTMFVAIEEARPQGVRYECAAKLHIQCTLHILF